MRHKPLIIAVVTLTLLSAWLFLPILDQAVHVSILDVGQGDAILVRQKDRELLIDGGPDGAVLGQLGAAMPFWDRDIELAVLTHPHADHFAGLTQVMGRYHVGTLITSGRENSTENHQAFKSAAAEEGSRVVVTDRGDEFMLSPDAKFRVLSPSQPNSSNDLNDASVVLELDAFGRRALFMGDATMRVEQELLERGDDLHADFLKVGHHGSKYSSSKEFLEAVHPAVAAVSVGKNSYGHPASATLRRLQDAGAKTWRTDRDGGLDIRISEKGIRGCRIGSLLCPLLGIGAVQL